jgi:hypothetical protein
MKFRLIPKNNLLWIPHSGFEAGETPDKESLAKCLIEDSKEKN